MPTEATELRLPTRGHYAVLIVLVALLFSPVTTFELVRWDDTHNFEGNPHLTPPTFDSVLFFWTRPYKDLYVPVTYTVWTLAATIAHVPTNAGPTFIPAVLHSLNVVAHVIAACGALALLFRLTHDRRAALLGALLFAVHPVQVESVAWASGLKDVLAGMFGLWALHAYVRAAQADSRRVMIRAYVIAAVLFVFAMLSKPSAVVLPAMAGAIDLLWLRRPLRNVMVPLSIAVVLAIPVVVIAKLVQPGHDAVFVPPVWGRPVVAMDALAFYLAKFVAPVSLAIDYGRSPLFLWHSSQKLWTWAVAVAVFAVAVAIRRRSPAPLVSILLLAFAVAPVSGLVPFDFQTYSTVSDHYLYLATIAPAFLLSALLSKHGRKIAHVTVVILLLALAGRSVVQLFTWRDSAALFTHAVEVNPTSVTGNVNLGNIVSDSGRATGNRALLHRAITHYQRALTVLPDDAVVWRNLGNQYTMLKDWPLAIAAYDKAVESDPAYAPAHSSLAWALQQAGYADRARYHYVRAMELDPSDDLARRGLVE